MGIGYLTSNDAAEDGVQQDGKRRYQSRANEDLKVGERCHVCKSRQDQSTIYLLLSLPVLTANIPT